MTQWAAGMLISADRLNDNTLKESTTTGLTASTGFTVNSFSGRRVNGITTIHCYVQRSGADITVTNVGDNIVDVSMCTLPSGWRPPAIINAAWGDGTVHGECTISAAGVITLRSTLNSITSGSNIRVTSTWISEND